jgi:hypothetical protein
LQHLGSHRSWKWCSAGENFNFPSPDRKSNEHRLPLLRCGARARLHDYCGRIRGSSHSADKRSGKNQRRQAKKLTEVFSNRMRTNIQAFSARLKDYPEFMSLWEKESGAAETFLAAERKARKPSNKKVARAIGDAHHKRAT